MLDFALSGTLLAFTSHTFLNEVIAAAVIEDTERRRTVVVPATWVRLDHEGEDLADN